MGVERRYDRASDDYERAMEGLERLLARLQIIDVPRPVAITAARIITDFRDPGEPLHDLHDVYVAATASVEAIPVLTANVDHFERIEDVRVVDWTAF